MGFIFNIDAKRCDLYAVIISFLRNEIVELQRQSNISGDLNQIVTKNLNVILKRIAKMSSNLNDSRKSQRQIDEFMKEKITFG